MRTVVKTYKFKLYKSKKNKHLDDGINIAASIWNYCIAMHRHYYRTFGKHLSANKLMKHITKVKKTLHRNGKPSAAKLFRMWFNELTVPTKHFSTT